MTQGTRIETQVAKEALEVSGEALEALVGTLEALEALEGTLGALEASVRTLGALEASVGTLEAMEWEAQGLGVEETHIEDLEDMVEAIAALIMGAVAAQGGMADTATTHLNEHPGQGSADISNLDVI